jgi:hypothetical protein
LIGILLAVFQQFSGINGIPSKSQGNM